MTKTLVSGLTTFASVIEKIGGVFSTMDDHRRGSNTIYDVKDAALSAFSVFFMQSPSFLEYQRQMKDGQGRSNVDTLFGSHAVPSDNQIRALLDGVDPSSIDPAFYFILNGLYDAKVIDQYRSVSARVLIAMDGLQYFSSQKIHCPQCSTRTRAEKITYSHSAVTPVLVHPKQDKVIPLPPEFIVPQDGHDKQDCELNAARRWLKKHHDQYSRLKATVLGDDLYCHEPFCRDLIGHGLAFILVCKPASHSTTSEWIEMLERSQDVHTLTIRRWTGRGIEIDTYRYTSNVPLREADDALMLNWCELTTLTEDGKPRYRNAFATTFAINANNVKEIVEAGRSRWKIENENNNTLKTKGYHFEHNFGHGKKHLSALLASFIILAYSLHTLIDWLDERFCLLRQTLPSRQRLFNDMRALTTYLCFESWPALIEFMIEGWNRNKNRENHGLC